MSVTDYIPIILALIVAFFAARFMWRRWGMQGVLGPFLYPIYEAYKERGLRFPLVTFLISLVLVIAYFIQPMLDATVFSRHLLTSQNINVFSLILAQISHANIFHLWGNLVALYIFGTLLEFWAGRFRYFIIYFLFGTLALAVGAFFVDPTRVIVGASANISAVMGAYVIYRVMDDHRSDRAKKWWYFEFIFIFLYLFLDDIFGFKDQSVGHGAHLAGAVAGILSAFLLDPALRKKLLPK